MAILQKKKTKQKVSPALSLLFKVVVGVSGIGSVIEAMVLIIGRALITPFIFIGAFFSLVAALARQASALVARYRAHVFFSLTSLLLFAFLVWFQGLARSLPYPHTRADIFKKTRIVVLDKDKTPLFEIRAEASYNASKGAKNFRENQKNNSVSSASRFLAQTQLDTLRNDALSPLKREIVAARIRAVFSDRDIIALKTAVSSPIYDPLVYKRAPLATQYALYEASEILGSKRFAEGGFTIYSTIDLALYNNLQADLLNGAIHGIWSSPEITVTRDDRGAVASINSLDLPTATSQKSYPLTPLISKIVTSGGQALYINSITKKNLTKGGDLDGY